MEAMAMSLPVVCTNVSGNVEAIIDGETGVVSEPNSESLARAIDELLSQPERWEDLGHAAHQRYLQLFEGDASVRALVDDYYGLAGSP
jgi:glycosyltransferase involved in cell wall biosynthesis